MFTVYDERALIVERLEASIGVYPRHSLTLQHFDALLERYDVVLAELELLVPVIRFQPSTVARSRLYSDLMKRLAAVASPERMTA